jgi:hypothetical protein
MIEDHLDPTSEAHAHITSLLRTVVTAAAGVAERRARQREEQLRDAQRRSEQHYRTLNERLTAERQTAELIYRRTYQDSWWDKARPDHIAAAVEAAGTWATSDPRANDALDHIAGRLHDRYDIDLAALRRSIPDPAAVSAAVRAHVADVEQTQVGNASAAPWDVTAVVMQAAGPILGAEILAAEGWHHLHRRLETLHDAGIDVPAQLRRAVTERELGSVKDKGLALAWRLRTPRTEPGVAGNHAATPSRRASHGSPVPGGRSKVSGSTEDARRLAANQRRTDIQKEAGPEAAAGP